MLVSIIMLLIIYVGQTLFNKIHTNYIFLATVTPSFVIFGKEYSESIATFLPPGPKVNLTVFLMRLTASAKGFLALLPNEIFFVENFFTLKYFIDG